MGRASHVKNLKNIIHHAFDGLFQSMWKFVVRRQNRFRLFEH